jgi:pSer/pThr/pTyr-binding forkhead associated (FHA) protein
MCGSTLGEDATFCDSCGYTRTETSGASSMISSNTPESFGSDSGSVPSAPVNGGSVSGNLVCPDGSEIPITETQKLLGRVDLSKFASKDDKNVISRGHFTVYQEGESFYVEDGKTRVQDKPSANKTWLISGGKEEEITGKGKRELQDGDEISVAGLVKLKFKTG